MLDVANWFQCLHFPGGLTQSDWFGLFTGTASLGYGVTAYNQAAYCSNVGWRQAQLYQEKNYHLAWAAVARDDVREMMSISVNRINNYMLVSTLIMAVAADALFFVQEFDDDCPPFVRNAFWLSMGLSIAFFALSIMFGIKGQNSAFVNTMRLLTWEIRPENPAPYTHDYMSQAQGFEKDGIRQLFRIPGIDAKYLHTQQTASSQKSLAGEPNPQKDGAVKEDRERRARDLEALNPRTMDLVYLERFAHYMQLWMPYEANAKYCIGLGLITLAQGGAYFSLGVLSWGKEGYGYVLACAMITIFVFLTIMVYSQNYKAKTRQVTALVITLFCWGPVSAAIAALVVQPAWVRMVFAPVTCLGQSCLYLGIWAVSFAEAKDPKWHARQYTEGPHGQVFGRSWEGSRHATGQEDSSQSSTPFTGAAPRHGLPEANKDAPTFTEELEEDARARTVAAGAIKTVRITLFLAGSLWLGLLMVELLPRAPWQQPHALQLQRVQVEWPSEAARSHALACAGGDIFVANRYQVFRLQRRAGRAALAEPWACGRLAAPIKDVAAACNSTGGCWPILLSQSERQQNVVVDCAGWPEAVLSQEHRPAEGFTFKDPDISSSARRMLALHSDGTVVEYSLPDSSSWRPLCERLDADSEDHGGSLAFLGKHLLLFSRKSNSLHLHDLDDALALPQRWQIDTHGEALQAGCVTSEGQLWVLTAGHKGPSLWQGGVGRLLA